PCLAHGPRGGRSRVEPRPGCATFCGGTGGSRRRCRGGLRGRAARSPDARPVAPVVPEGPRARRRGGVRVAGGLWLPRPGPPAADLAADRAVPVVRAGARGELARPPRL